MAGSYSKVHIGLQDGKTDKIVRQGLLNILILLPKASMYCDYTAPLEALFFHLKKKRSNALQNLQKLGIVKDISGRGKERIYVYTELVTLLEEGAGLIA